MTHAQAQLAIQQNFRGIVDSTLREGEQFSGCQEISLVQAKKILTILARLGIKKAEVPNPVAPGMETYVRQLARLRRRPALLAHIRNNPTDLQTALTTGIDGVNILLTIDQRRLDQIHHTRESYLEQMRQLISRAKQRGLQTRVSIEHSWSYDLSQLLPVYRQAIESGADLIGIADTLGQATHWAVAEKVAAIRAAFPQIAIEVHFHNDLQEATANALEALAAGANWVDTTLGGFGERTGITPLSALLARLATLSPDWQLPYNPTLLTKSERLMAEFMGVDIPYNLITSSNSFAHKAGIHLNGILRQGPSLYEPFAPGVVGGKRLLVCGTRISGRTTAQQVAEFYRQNGRS